MDAWLAANYPIAITTHPTRGRCVVASRALPAGTPILACAAAAAHVLPSARASCAHCFSPSQPLQRCVGCRAVGYCGRDCQRADWPCHKGECAHAEWMWRGGALRGGAGDAVTLTLLSRLQRGLALRRGDGAATPREAALAAAMAGARVYVHTPADVEGLCSAPRSAAPRLAESLEACIEAAGRQGLWVPPGSAPAMCNLFTGPKLLRAALSFDPNNFSIPDDICVGRGAGVFPAGALLNHSCAPNCVPLFLTGEAAGAALGGGGGEAGAAAGRALPFAARSARVLAFRTVRAVGAGEELTHSYVDLALPRAQRGEYLKGVYGFACACAACAAPAGARRDTDAALLGGAEGGRVVLGVPRMRVGEAAVGGGGGGGGGAEGGGEEVLNELGALPPPLRAALLEAQELIVAGRRVDAAGRPLEGGCGEGGSLLDRLGAKLGAEALARVRRAALAGVEGIDAGEALSVGREVWALERGLAALRPRLSPFHVQAQTAVAGAMDKYLQLSDVPAAVAACEHLVAFYSAVYGPLCPNHAMLSLQLITLGDLYKKLAEDAGEGGAPPPGGGGSPSAAAAAAAGAGAPARLPPWRSTPARAAELAALFVQRGALWGEAAAGEGGGAAAVAAAAEEGWAREEEEGAPPPHAPASGPVALEGEAPAAAAARWRARAAAAFAGAARMLAISHGTTSPLFSYSQERLGEVLRP